MSQTDAVPLNSTVCFGLIEFGYAVYMHTFCVFFVICQHGDGFLLDEYNCKWALNVDLASRVCFQVSMPQGYYAPVAVRLKNKHPLLGS